MTVSVMRDRIRQEDIDRPRELEMTHYIGRKRNRWARGGEMLPEVRKSRKDLRDDLDDDDDDDDGMDEEHINCRVEKRG